MMAYAMKTAMAAAAAVVMAAQGAEAQRDDFRWAGQVARGESVRVQAISGSVQAEPSSGDRVEVVGHFVGPRASDLRVQVIERDGGIIVCTIYPGTRDVGGRENPCGSHRGNWRGNLNGDNRVNFVVKVPAGVRLEASTVSGDVTASNLRGDVEASTVSGDVRISTRGHAEASTVSGRIEATVGDEHGEDMSFSTVSGDVVVRLGDDVDADVSASTLSGSLRGDLRAADEGRRRWGPGRNANMRVGRGGPDLALSTVSGDIRVERSR